MTRKGTWWAILAIAIGLASDAWAQDPLAGGAAAGESAAGGAAGGASGFCAKLVQCLKACKAKMCAAPCGQLLNNGLAPLSCLTGGVIPKCCPTTPSAAQQAQPGAAGAAAQIQADTAASKARVAAVEYLGTVDCHYWPEAEKNLIDALRADRNECVRFAAARALCSSCCCTKKTIAALVLTVTGDNTDGNPSENSMRVRAAASEALARCGMVPLESIKPQPPERPVPVPPETPPVPGVAPIPLESVDPSLRRTEYYYETVDRMPRAVFEAQARRALALASRMPREPGMPPLGGHSLLDIASNARSPQETTPTPPTATTATATPTTPTRLPSPRPVSPRLGAEVTARPAPSADGPQSAGGRPRPESSHTLMDVFRQSRSGRDDAS